MLLSKKNNEKTSVIGVLGGGQLAKMLALDAYRMGFELAVIENHSGSPAGDATKLDFDKGWLDPAELRKFAEASDIITLENEFVDPDVIAEAEKITPVFPTSKTMRLVQDKLTQKDAFSAAKIPVPEYAAINSTDQAMLFGAARNFNFVIKARKYGYDGYGNATVRSESDVDAAWEKLGADRALMAEEFVDFEMEIAVMVARNTLGETALYPCVQTVQRDHILNELLAPAPIEPPLREKAQDLARRAVEAIDGVGVFGVEMFLDKSGRILLNEIAPRPHNSGHYTIEACRVSQYENCIRAVCGLPLGSPELVAPAAALVNLLGAGDGPGTPKDVSAALMFKNARIHLYNKKRNRLGRKMGHITVLGETPQGALAEAKAAAKAIVWV